MSRRKSLKHNDEFINQKAEEKAKDLWRELTSKYLLTESLSITDLLKNRKPITYGYLKEFVDFHKKFDENFCITAIYKTQDKVNAGKDILQCLNKRGWSGSIYEKYGKDKIPIYYVDYQFANDYDCPHGDDYKDVYLMMFTLSEDETLYILQKFEKLKAFV